MAKEAEPQRIRPMFYLLPHAASATTGSADSDSTIHNSRSMDEKASSEAGCQVAVPSALPSKPPAAGSGDRLPGEAAVDFELVELDLLGAGQASRAQQVGLLEMLPRLRRCEEHLHWAIRGTGDPRPGALRRRSWS